MAELHPYDAPERAIKTTIFSILVLSGAAAFLLSQALDFFDTKFLDHDLERVAWIAAPSWPGVFWIFFHVWDRWVWKWRRLGRIPNLSGSWVGRVHTDDPVIAPLLGEDAKCEVVITQHWWKMAVAFASKASTSISEAALIQRRGIGYVELVYIYYARPRDPTQREQFPAHYGTVVTTQQGQRDHLDAYFWTSPWPQHSGRLELHRASDRPIDWSEKSCTKPPSAAPTLIVDCDPGIDDALALLYLSAFHRGIENEIALVTVAAGNVSLEQAWANAIHVMGLAGMADVELVPGSERPLVGAVPEENGADFHGSSGLGTMSVSPRPSTDRPRDEAARKIVDAVNALHKAKKPCWLLCLAPLTNVAKALLLDPAIAQRVERCVVMGGAFGNPHGNIRDWAEYNVWWDPAAARVVFESGMPIRLVPLDATHLLTVGDGDLAAIGGPALQLLQDRIALHKQAATDPGALVHDAMAAIALLSEDLFEWRSTRVAVDVAGPTPGRTQEVQGPHGVPVEIAEPKDPDDLKDRLLRVLARPGPVVHVTSADRPPGEKKRRWWPKWRARRNG
jgi:purine nucleosidase